MLKIDNRHIIEIRVCKQCGKEFKCYRDGKNKFCTRECYAISLKHDDVINICGQCGNGFVVVYAKRNRKKFCGEQCRQLNNKELALLRWPNIKDSFSHKGKSSCKRSVVVTSEEKELLKSIGFKKEHVTWNIGKKLSVEHKGKLSISHKGKNLGNKNAAGNKNWLGKKFSDEHRKKLSDSHIGIKQSEEAKQKRRDHWQNPEFVKKQMTSRHVTPNKTELNFLDILNSISPQPFKYVGDGQLIVAGKCPDYVCETNDRLLIELYGDYWHRGENPQERINLFAENGYKTLIVWEKELRDTEKLSNNILLFIRS